MESEADVVSINVTREQAAQLLSIVCASQFPGEHVEKVVALKAAIRLAIETPAPRQEE
jgi:hypothetical protein